MLQRFSERLQKSIPRNNGALVPMHKRWRLMQYWIVMIVLSTIGACGTQSRNQDRHPAPLRMATSVDTLTLCEGMTRHVAVVASWHGSTTPAVGDLPDITWVSSNVQVVHVDARSGGMTGMSPGTSNIVILGRVRTEMGRAILGVTVLEGKWDREASRISGELICGRL